MRKNDNCATLPCIHDYNRILYFNIKIEYFISCESVYGGCKNLFREYLEEPYRDEWEKCNWI